VPKDDKFRGSLFRGEKTFCRIDESCEIVMDLLTRINFSDIFNEIIIKAKKRSSKYIGIVQREDGWCESSQSVY